VIKRIRLATRAAGVPAETFAAAWPGAVAAAADAPPGVRPVRVAACVTLPDLTGPDPRHDGASIEWFTDAAHLERFQTWLGTAARVPANEALTDPAASPVIVAEEIVLRGADWLERRWRAGGEAPKQMAIAERAPGLTSAQFAERWRDKAGQVRGTVIPDAARGRAYVQNHPRPRAVGDWAYDAVNEVYFDDAAGLRARIEWFRENAPDPGGDDLFGPSWFIAAREVVLA
jgi:hypothetical protein